MTTTNSYSAVQARQSHTRGHSHTISAGSLNNNHRITRRKSVSSSVNTNSVVIAAAVKEINGGTVSAISVPMPSTRRSSMARTPGAKAGSLSNNLTPPSSLTGDRTMASQKLGRSESDVDDYPNEEDELEEPRPTSGFGGTRRRRASEGQYLKGEGKKQRAVELKCAKCGKGYKHSSCLTKHLWEHTPHWSLTSTYLISKHQQVQLLEAASALYQMKGGSRSPLDITPPASVQDFQSDQEGSSASPAASGYSDLRDSRQSSADTTPPPRMDYRDDMPVNSYPSAPSPLLNTISGSFGFAQSTELSPDFNAICTGNKEEDEVLANAIFSLSCFANSRVPSMPADPPRAPVFPVRHTSYASQQIFPNSSALAPIYKHEDSYAASERYHNYEERSQVDVKMEDVEDSVMDEYDYERDSRGRSDEDDEGIFGMDE